MGYIFKSLFFLLKEIESDSKMEKNTHCFLNTLNNSLEWSLPKEISDE